MIYDRKPCQDSGYLLWQISNIWQKKINEILLLHEITHVQYLLLATIVWMENSEMVITQNTLAKQAQSHKMMTSKVIRSLEKNGLVLRNNNPSDSRSKLISITPLGREKYQKVKTIFKQEDRRFFNKYEMNRFSLNRIFTDLLAESRLTLSI